MVINSNKPRHANHVDNADDDSASPNIPSLQIVLNYDIGMNCLILNGKIFHGEEARGQGEKRKFVEFSELFILLELKRDFR